MSALKNELIGLVVGASVMPFIIPVYIGYHFFYKEKSGAPVQDFKQVTGVVISK